MPMQHSILSTSRFEVGYNANRVGLTCIRSGGKTLTMLIDTDEAETVGRALIEAVKRFKEQSK